MTFGTLLTLLAADGLYAASKDIQSELLDGCRSIIRRRLCKPIAPASSDFPDFGYVLIWQGWLQVTFVIDIFTRCIVGWQTSILCTRLH